MCVRCTRRLRPYTRSGNVICVSARRVINFSRFFFLFFTLSLSLALFLLFFLFSPIYFGIVVVVVASARYYNEPVRRPLAPFLAAQVFRRSARPFQLLKSTVITTTKFSFFFSYVAWNISIGFYPIRVCVSLI